MKIVVVSYCADQDQTFYDAIPVPDSLLASYPFEDQVDVAKTEATERVDRLRGDYAEVIDTFTDGELFNMARKILDEGEEEAERAFSELEDEARD